MVDLGIFETADSIPSGDLVNEQMVIDEFLGFALLAKTGLHLLANNVFERVFGFEDETGLGTALLSIASGVIQNGTLI